ncbi:unnamed protein product [Darwinula stevensoni]|uniref:ERAP1-like C-terminal domain-containing protein n=1 Tax=Darwinula stevensoni TaxID=69355 RepID=A0A7R8X5H3_9CRUS|nr:unnamed protein product [Darwinula stevensoni]CAG0887113.1 unnamed protein product [Darwinula stevensoni]
METRVLEGEEEEDRNADTPRASGGDEVRIPDTVSIVLSVAEHKEGRDLAWKFLQENWPELSRRYGAGFHMTRLLQGVTGHYCLESQAEEVKIYFQDLASRDENSPKRVFDQCIENIWIQARWCQRDLFNCLA